jgi:hypothetical protein
MKTEFSERDNLMFRALLAVVMIILAAVLRIAPHPLNFTPIGAMALFSGALLRDKRLAFMFPLVALFVGDCFVGFHKLMPVVYVSFLINVAIGLYLRNHRTVGRISAAVLFGAIQFFIVTNFGLWAMGSFYPRTAAGLVACYVGGIPYFWNTLAGDAVYATVLFGGFALAERFSPRFREPVQQVG